MAILFQVTPPQRPGEANHIKPLQTRRRGPEGARNAEGPKPRKALKTQCPQEDICDGAREGVTQPSVQDHWLRRACTLFLCFKKVIKEDNLGNTNKLSLTLHEADSLLSKN